MTRTYRVALLGFSEFERTTLASFFRLAAKRTPHYVQVTDPSAADFIVADADHGPAVQLVSAAERLAETVFIGALAPDGSLAWMPRPIDPLRVMRELDGMVAMATGGTAPPPLPQPSPPQPPQHLPPTAPVPAPAEQLAPALSAIVITSPHRSRAPAAPPARAPGNAAAIDPAPQWPMRSPLRASALLVDDSAIATRFLETRLARWGLEISRASNSKEAVALLEQRDFDFVFLDLELGADSELDGLALCQHIKRHGAGNAAIHSAVVMVSAHQSELDRVRGALAGCDAYLGKPLDEVELHRLMLRHGMRAVVAAG